MTLNEKVSDLFAKQHALTSESIRRFENKLSREDIEQGEKNVQEELKSILDSNLRGEFTIDHIEVDKKDATVYVTNNVFVIPCRVQYKQFGLSEFARKPGKKQIEKREEELRKIPISTMKDLNRYVVGVSHFEAQEGSYVVFCRSIKIVA